MGALPTLQRVTTLPAPPPRLSEGHKGSFGKVMLIAGSPGMTGAAGLAGMGALRGGAGLVTVATPRSVVPIVAGYEPSYLTLPLAEDAGGRISREAFPGLWQALQGITAAAIGPGLGQSPDLTDLVTHLHQTAPWPMVIDADGLNNLAAGPWRTTPSQPRASRIFTPHLGEFARLTGRAIGEIQGHREEVGVDFARKHQVLLVLKGAGTLITDGVRLAINTTGNNGMATGGSGDVLTGLLVALLGQGMPAFEAAQFGVHLHGLAGDLAAAALSEPGMIASDLVTYLPAAWKTILP